MSSLYYPARFAQQKSAPSKPQAKRLKCAPSKIFGGWPPGLDLADSVPYPANQCSPNKSETIISPPAWPREHFPVWNNRFVLRAIYPETGITAVEYSYFWSSFPQGGIKHFDKKIIWFSHAGIDAIEAAGWKIEQ